MAPDTGSLRLSRLVKVGRQLDLVGLIHVSFYDRPGRRFPSWAIRLISRGGKTHLFTSRRTCRRRYEGRGTPLDRMDTAARRTRLWSRLACAEAAQKRIGPTINKVSRSRCTLRLLKSGFPDRRWSSDPEGVPIGPTADDPRRDQWPQQQWEAHWGHRATASRCATASGSTSCSHRQPPAFPRCGATGGAESAGLPRMSRSVVLRRGELGQATAVTALNV